MPDRYRGQLPGYRTRALGSIALPEMVRRLDPQRGEALLACVERLLADLKAAPIENDRRRSFRRPYPRAMLVTPCDEDGQPIVSETQTVVAKDLSPGNIGFVHTRALTESKVLLTFMLDEGEPICVVANVRRNQPVRQGLYLIGADFEARVVPGERHGQPR